MSKERSSGIASSTPSTPVPIQLTSKDQEEDKVEDQNDEDNVEQLLSRDKVFTKTYNTANKTDYEAHHKVIELGYEINNHESGFLGKGAFGEVKKAKATKKDNITVAIKMINLNKAKRKGANAENELRHEVYVLSKVKRNQHKNIIEMIDHFRVDDIFYLVLGQ